MRTVVEKWLPVYQRALENYEREHPHWLAEVVWSLIKWGLRCLKHYIEDPRTRKITWSDPFVELRYEVDWNWNRSAAGDVTLGGHTFGTLTRKNTATEELAMKTLGEIMARQLTVMGLGELTNGAWYEKRGGRYTPVLPVETSVELNSIKNLRARRDALGRLLRPFAIGGAYVDFSSMKMRSGEPVAKEVASQLAEIGKIPRVDFSVDMNGRKFELSLVFLIEPLVADYSKRKAYHSITVGLAFRPEVTGTEIRTRNSPAEWSRKDQQEFWEGLLQKIEGIEAGLIPKVEAEESVILSVNSQLKVPASWWKPENRSTTIKQIADLQSVAGELQGLSVQAAANGPSQITQPACAVCGWIHDPGFTQLRAQGDSVITLGGILPDIVRVIHEAHAKGFERLSTKDRELLGVCGGYRHPCKAFDDLNHRAEYKRLFDTSRRGFISLRGAVGMIRNKSESNPE